MNSLTYDILYSVETAELTARLEQKRLAAEALARRPHRARRHRIAARLHLARGGTTHA